MSEHEIDASHALEHQEEVEDTETYLDAMSIRSKLEFDPDFARSIASMVNHAARIVEDSRSVDRDKPPPHSIQSPQIYQDFLIQERAEAQRLQAATDAARLRREIAQQKAEIQKIAARVQSQKAITQPWHIQAARNLIIHGSPHQGSLSEKSVKSPAANQSQELSVSRILLIGGIPVATVTLGVTLLVESALQRPVVPNPYVGLFALLAGFALLATAVAAIRERRKN